MSEEKKIAKETETKKVVSSAKKKDAVEVKDNAPVKKVVKPAASKVKAEPAKKVETVKKAEPAKTVEAKVEVKKETKAKVEVKEVAKPSNKPSKKGPAKRAESTRLLEKYQSEVKKALMEKYHYKSIMQVPALEKIIINVGAGEGAQNAKVLEDVSNEISLIAGQHPVITKAKKSIANFKLREGQSIGCKVTLRDIRMYEFLDRLVTIALPRVRDFRGISKNSFDGHGNYTLGIKEQLIFPEIEYDKVSKIRGMDITIVTTAKSDDEAFSLLSMLGLPFRK